MDVSAPPKDVSSPQHSSANGDFDCNICLDLAMDPVVTLCGHLYCSHCIGKWLMFEKVSPQTCPVCKASLSRDSLVHLHVRGSIPKRTWQPTPDGRRPRYNGGYGGELPPPTNWRPQLRDSAAGGVMGEMEVGMYYWSRYHRVGGTGWRSAMRRPEMGVERLLMIWLFVLCSAAFYILLL